MAAKKKYQKKAGKVGPRAEARRALLEEGGGFDWGWTEYNLVSANDQLVRRLAAGQFVGCSYGLVSREGPPFISLVGHNLAGMQSALALMNEWVDKAGSNAIRLEILFDDPGYVLSVGPHPDFLRWRVGGLDTVNQPIVVTIGLVKRLDTRHPFLEQLAEYARKPVAPVWLTVSAAAPQSRGRSGALAVSDLRSSWENAILLPGVEIYAKPEELPRDSMVRLKSELPGEQGEGWLLEPPVDAASVARTRERRLLATLPRTMHRLRHSTVVGPLFVGDGIGDCARWQVEQAICNLRLPSFLAYAPSSKAKRLAVIDALRRDLVEPASTVFDPNSIDSTALVEQISLDTAYLLRRLEPAAPVPEGLAARNGRLRELGYG